MCTLHVQINTLQNEPWGAGCNDPAYYLPLKKWSNVKIFIGENWIKVDVNGVQKCRKQFTKWVKSFNNVNLHLSDQWHSPTHADIRNFRINSRGMFPSFVFVTDS